MIGAMFHFRKNNREIIFLIGLVKKVVHPAFNTFFYKYNDVLHHMILHYLNKKEVLLNFERVVGAEMIDLTKCQNTLIDILMHFLLQNRSGRQVKQA